MTLNVRIVKGSTVFHVHGDQAGAEGVYLAQGQVQGLYDSPVKTTWKAGAFQTGATFRGRRFEHRDLVLGFHIMETLTSWEFNDSEFRRSFDFEVDPWDPDYEPTIVEVETELSGVRKLDVLLHEAPDFDAPVDPIRQQHGNLILKLRAGEPFWYTDDIVSEFSGSGASGSGVVTVSNPSDQTAFHKWVLSPGNWTLPDREWSGPKGARSVVGSRNVNNIAVTQANGGAVVDLDRNELMFRDVNNTNLLAQLAGKFFEYPIPPYTPPVDLPVSYTGGPANLQVRIPQRWSRPWGMEMDLSGGS